MKMDEPSPSETSSSNINETNISIWKPSTLLTKLKRSNTMSALGERDVSETKLEEVETEMLKSVKSSFERFHVNISYQYPHPTCLKVWTIAINKHLQTTPIVLIHGFMSGLAPWRFSLGSYF